MEIERAMMQFQNFKDQGLVCAEYIYSRGQYTKDAHLTRYLALILATG